MVRPLPALAVPLVLAAALLVPLSVSQAQARPTASPPPPAPPPAALAPTADGWKRLSSGPVDSLSQATTERTSDGVLHAVYEVEAGGAEAYEHARLTGTGASLGTNQAFPAWGGLVNDPQLVPGPGGGLRLVFSGLQDTDSSNFYSAGFMYEALSDASGAAFAVQPRALTKAKIAYGGYGTGAVTLDDGRPMSSTALNADLYHRAGTIETTDILTALTFPDDGHTVTNGNAFGQTLVKAGGTVWMAWFALFGDNPGIFVQQVHPTVGAVLEVPGSDDAPLAFTTDQAVPITARPDGSVVVAYPTGYPTVRGINLWQVGSGSVTRVRGTGDARLVDLDAGGAGRLWLAWSDNSTDDVSLLRSGETGFAMGGRRDLGKPDLDVNQLAVDVTDAQASVLANSMGTMYYQQVEPVPLVKVGTKSVRAGTTRSVRFTVRDAGVGVRGVRVRAAGRSCTTNRKGVCTLKVGRPRPGKVRVKVIRKGYATVTQTIKITR